MFETYRMLGEQREAELLAEARRLQAGQAVKDGSERRPPASRLVSMFRSKAVALRIGLLGATRRAEKPKAAPAPLDP
jgi:hypothetical protein